MNTPRCIRDVQELLLWLDGGGVAPLGVEEFLVHRPDAHWILCDTNGALVARVSLWWSAVPESPDQRLGFIGHFAAADESAATILLDHACNELRMHRCTRAIGPLDGTTWRPYRFIIRQTGEDHRPPFFLEPWHPPTWPEWWMKAGFIVDETYSSALVESIEDDPRIAKLEPRMRDAGIDITSPDPRMIPTLLSELHELSLTGFAGNMYYSPIERGEFLAQYNKILPFVRPELILLARRARELVGFIFALPDLLEVRSGTRIDTVILKSLAVDPETRGIGLGTLLMARVQQVARDLGYQRAIHALMHEENTSKRISAHDGEVFRRYALFARELTP